MINRFIIYKVLGSLLLLEAVLFAVCFGMGFVFKENVWFDFGAPLAVATGLGLLLKHLGRRAAGTISRRDGYLCVTLSWVLFSFVGTLPFLLGGHTARFAVAFFESTSGFTTTGATALSNIDTLPHAILLWRSLIHWMGGLGIVFFTVAILPSMGSGGSLRLFSAEATGLRSGKLHPRIGTTARWLWGVYLFLTVSCAAAYYLGGMSIFDAVNHAFSTVATGGFSTHQTSLGYYASPTLELIAACFMFLSGINFTLLYLLLIKGRLRTVVHDSELRFYVTLMTCAVVVVATALLLAGNSSIGDTLRESFFNVTALLSSTGFTSGDLGLWPHATWFVLILLTAIGACAGSTTGGIKCIRVLTSLKVFSGEFRRLLHPSAVLPLRLNQTPVTAGVSHTVFAFLVAYLVLLLGGALLYLLMGLPLLDAFSMTISMLSNAGLTFGHVIGPLGTWDVLPDAGLWLSSLLMLAGRLEIFSLLLPLTPTFWHDN